MNKVLIIEDDQAYRKIYKRKFEVSGYTAETAENGVEGLEKMRSFQPNIVFVDLMMPQMDGFHFLEAVKSDPALQNIPIVVLTNLSTSEDAQKVLEMGAKAILVKSNTEPNAIVEKANQIIGDGNENKPKELAEN